MLLAKDAPKNLVLGRTGLHLPSWLGGGKQAVSCGAGDCILFSKSPKAI